MKKSLSLIILIIVDSVTFAQQRYQDTIYLKNGTSINGKINGWVKNKSIEIQTIDKKQFIFDMDEIEKIAKKTFRIENSNTDLTTNSATKRNGFIGLSGGLNIPLKGDYVKGIQVPAADFGYLFNNNFGVTVLIGINSYQTRI
jgi:hypothetical protein